MTFSFKNHFSLAPMLVGLDVAHAGGWSLWRPFSFNLPHSYLFRNFWHKLTLNKPHENFCINLVGRYFICRTINFRTKSTWRPKAFIETTRQRWRSNEAILRWISSHNTFRGKFFEIFPQSANKQELVMHVTTNYLSWKCRRIREALPDLSRRSCRFSHLGTGRMRTGRRRFRSWNRLMIRVHNTARLRASKNI